MIAFETVSRNFCYVGRLKIIVRMSGNDSKSKRKKKLHVRMRHWEGIEQGDMSFEIRKT
jgi:hypothetical protein